MLCVFNPFFNCFPEEWSGRGEAKKGSEVGKTPEVVPLPSLARCVCPLPERPCQSSSSGGLSQSGPRGGGGEVREGRGGDRVE